MKLEVFVMQRIRPLTALWKGGLYIFVYFQKLYPFLQQSWTPCWCMSFLSQQKLLLRRDFIRKCFDILLFWNRNEWWNKTFQCICTIQILQLFLLLLCLKTHGRKCSLKLLVISLCCSCVQLSSRSAYFPSFEGAHVSILQD